MASDWSEEEVRFLLENWTTLTTAEINERIGRSPNGIRRKAFKLGLPCRTRKDGWGAGEEYLSRQRAVGLACVELRALKPRHAVQYEECSTAWYDACNKAFVDAMHANPSERPSDIPEEQRTHVNMVGRVMPRRDPPSWSSMGDMSL
jgi:hypothetical protein